MRLLAIQGRFMGLFTRKSTGLVRQGGIIDSFIFNSSSSWIFGPLVFALSSLIWLPGADLISAEVIAVAFALVIAIMYALLTSLMPRSGGDYVFNSRALHPSVGFSFNFSLTVWQLFSAAFTLYFISSYALSPGLQVLGYFSNLKWLTILGTELGNPLNSFILASVINILFTFVIAAGIKRTFRVLNALWALTILGTIVMILSLLFTNTAAFHSGFNSYFTSVNGTNSVADPFGYVLQQSPSINYSLALPAIAICASSVIWSFWETYVAGEVRRASQAKRNITSMGGAVVLNGFLFVVLVYLLFRTVGPQFITSVTALSYNGVIFNSPLQAITAIIILATGNFYSALMLVVAVTLGTTILLLPALYLQPIRSLFAWSFDRIVPSRISDVSDRLHTPMFSTILVFLVIEGFLLLITAEYQYFLGIFYAVIIAPAFSSIFPTALSAISISSGRRRLFGAVDLPSSRRRILLLLGTVSLVFILFMTYVFVSNESDFGLNPGLVSMNFAFIPIGFVLYYIARQVRKSKNAIDLNKIALEIPPE